MFESVRETIERSRAEVGGRDGVQDGSRSDLASASPRPLGRLSRPFAIAGIGRRGTTAGYPW
jgi:hypothetical protein